MARLGDLYKITSGGTPSRKHLEYYQNGTIPWVKTGDLKEKYLQATDERITEIGLKNSSARIYPQDTVLIAMYGATIGASSILKIEAATNQACAAFVKRDDVVPEYLYAFLESQQSRFIKDAVGGAQPNISAGYLRKIEIPLPSLEEQRRIAALLDKVSGLIAKRRAQLDKLDLLVKARFVEMFGDLAAPECPHKKCKLVETCVSSDDIKCGPFGTQLSKEEYQDHGVAVWEIPQINSYFTTQPTHFLTVEKAEQLKAYSIIPGDIAMSRKGNVGRCALFPDNFDSGIIHSDVLRIRVDKQQVNPCFMMYQLHFSGAVQRQIEVVSSGAIMAGVNVTKLKHIEIHLPDFDLQQQFAHFVGEVDRVKYSINNSLEKLETLKKALMQQYFG